MPEPAAALTTSYARRRGPLARFAGWCRRLADIADPDGAPRLSALTFTIEPGIGLVLRDDSHGARIGWVGLAEYDRAHAEAGPPPVPCTAWLPHAVGAGSGWPPHDYRRPARPYAEPLSFIASAGPEAALAAILAVQQDQIHRG